MLFAGTDNVSSTSNSTINVIHGVYLVVFLFIFSTILLKMFISIVIIRYEQLRSKTQLHNEAQARFFQNKGEEFKRRVMNFL